MTSRKIYVGYDSREDIAWQVARHSLRRHTTRDIDIYPIKQAALRELGLYTRPFDKTSSTEFSLTRFLTPYLAAHDGWTIFVDCDVLFTQDVNKVFENLDDSKALYCVHHDYTPANMIKMDGKEQTVYPRKNWSSFMIFNGAHPDVKKLSPKIVNAAAPAWLHRFEWTSDDMIGELPREWNFLEGEYKRPADLPANIHFTNGGPWFDEWKNVDFAEEWLAEEAAYVASLKTALEPA